MWHVQFACGFGEMACAEVLLEHKADVEAKDNNQNTALHYAAGYGQLETTQLLLKQYALWSTLSCSDSVCMRLTPCAAQQCQQGRQEPRRQDTS